jgi:uncharacterized protein (TIGR00661 family)
MENPKRILVAPLNWGLGHATRCMPIIHALLAQGHEVLLASDGRALDLLKREFPDLTALELPAYDVRYSRKFFLTFLILQMPRVLLAIWREHRTLQQWVRQYRLDAVISDNRLGCFTRQAPCVVLSHQLRIFTRPAWIGHIATFLHRRILQRYDACWIPDFEGPANLSGELAHGMTLPHMHYLGPLSRMKPGQEERSYDVLVILSGPEPGRTEWEKAILRQAADIPLRWLIVQGKPEQNEQTTPHPHIAMRSFLGARELNQAILQAEVVVSRSGYSTIMDLAVLGKKALLVSTPGQPEQEYLAQYGAQKGWFATQSQDKLDLKEGIKAARAAKGLQLEGTEAYDLAAFLKKWM